MKTLSQRCRRLAGVLIASALIVGLSGCGNPPPAKPTTTTLSSSTPSPSLVGKAVNLKATVSPVFPFFPFFDKPTVTLRDTSTVPATVLDTEPLGSGTGTAQFSILSLLPGTHTLTATFNAYNGTGGSYAASTSDPLTQVVDNLGTLATTTTLNASPSPSAVGQSVTLTAVVSPNGPTMAAPSGSVTFQQGTVFLGTASLTNGTATLTTSALTGGSDTLTAAYSGDATFAPSGGSFAQTVQGVTVTILTSSLPSSVVGQSVTFTAAVSAGSSPTPTGTVQFAIDGADVGGPVALGSSGKATDTETGLTPGSHTVTVTLAPTSAVTGSTVATLTQTVVSSNDAQYVSPSGNDSGDGSQGSPKQTIQAAVTASPSGGTVIVEDGTYSGAGNCDIDFGGKNLTVQSASGDPTRTIIDCGGSASSIHRGFFFHSGETTAVVSGLTVRSGYEDASNGGSTNPVGSGGAVAVASGSTATLTNCILTGNRSIRGGGIYNNGMLTLTNCALTGNVMEGVYDDGGGGLYSLGTVSATNCTFSGNSADGYGGGVTNSGPAVLTGCTLTGNSATAQGGGLFNNGALTLTDDIVYGNTGGEVQYDGGAAAVAYCDVQGGFTGTGNINADPLFVNAATGDLHLQTGSPCLGAGTSTGAPANDKDGYPRPNPPSIGAYERPTGSHTHLLWNNPDGRVILWSIAPDGAFTENTFGPYTDDGTPRTPWTAKAVATGPDGKSHILWTNPDGRVILWTVDDSGNFTYQVYGPYTDDGTAATPWSAVALSVGADNLVHLLWTNPDGRVILWNVDTSFNFTYQVFGPYTDDGTPNTPWYAVALAMGPDNVSRILWTNPDGRVILWKIDDSFNFSYQVYGPYTDDGTAATPWGAAALSVGPDNLAHLLWTNPDGRVILWNVDASFNFTYAVFGPTSDGSPSAPWEASALATGPDGLSHLLWTNPDGRVLLWGVDSGFSFTPSIYGPFTDGSPQDVWSAAAVSAGP